MKLTPDNVLMTNEMHNSYNQFLFHRFLSAVHVSKESSLSSSAARHNILHYTVWYNRYNRAGESSCFEVVGAVLLMMNDYIRSKHAEQTKKNCGIKVDHKNCASRWSLTRCNMMHGTHNVRLISDI